MSDPVTWRDHLKRSMKYGEWVYGFAIYKNKPWFKFATTYWDGNHWIFHLGPFYIGRSYY